MEGEGSAMAYQSGQKQENDIRLPVVAGRFYPASASALKQAVRKFMEDAVPVQVKNPLAIVVPHAGYVFSGQIAADGFRQAADHSYDVVVILGTNHTSGSFRKISVYPGDGFSTSLGTAMIDKEAVEALLAADPECVPDKSLHQQEHSIEVQLPFIQILFPDARIVPAVIGSPDIGLCRRFGKALAGVLKNRRALIVASADLSHYPHADAAEDVDDKTLAAMEKLDPALLQKVTQTQMNRGIPNLHTCCCGEAAVMAAMSAAKAMGATGGKVIRYAHSGNVQVGERDRVVGYGAVVYHGDPGNASANESGPPTAASGAPLTGADKRALLTLVRETLARKLSRQPVPMAQGLSPGAQQKRGVFVTLKKRGGLRGCIGRMIPDKPLHELVGAVALQSALEDPRFRPVTLEELQDLEIEISVLTPMAPIPNADHIIVGRDGVLIRKGGRSAVFLPQVAPEQGWGRDEMLEHLCRKAGLLPGSWKEGSELLTFQAIVFSEADFKSTP
jgi:AmmeMemoRadiSam system protein B/AmmeMemoRadiSam system protein A